MCWFYFEIFSGECICGKCLCNYPFDGQYCQYQCPTSKDGQICSGASQGKCIEGKCACNDDFEGEDCSCSKSTSKCKLFAGMDYCSGNGDCVCNQCKCNSGFSGPFCESNSENNTLCEQYIKAIETAILNDTDRGVIGTTKFVIQEVDDDKRRSYCSKWSYCLIFPKYLQNRSRSNNEHDGFKIIFKILVRGVSDSGRSVRL